MLRITPFQSLLAHWFKVTPAFIVETLVLPAVDLTRINSTTGKAPHLAKAISYYELQLKANNVGSVYP